jgi:CHASE2 domain-containing sensor protein
MEPSWQGGEPHAGWRQPRLTRLDIWILIVGVVMALFVAFVVRPRRTLAWTAAVAAPLVAVGLLVIAFGGLNPLAPPTVLDLLLTIFVGVLFAPEVGKQPEVRAWLGRRGRSR